MESKTMNRHFQHHQGNAARVGQQPYFGDITLAALARYNIAPGKDEIFKDSLYDSVAYAAAGQTSLSYFSSPVGQGTGFGGGTKTYSDTNMDLAGQLSAGTGFLIDRIEVEFQPTTPSVTADMPAVFGAQRACQLVNDAYVFGRSGYLSFTGPNNKVLLINGPMYRFPSVKNFEVDGALADVTTAGASLQSRTQFARWTGEPFDLFPVPIWLDSNMKFGIQLKWDEGVQALPSGNPARVFVRLGGLRVHIGGAAQTAHQHHHSQQHHHHRLMHRR
jgi:hypothetical protein